MAAAVHVLEQAERNDIFSVSDRHAARFNFSHLYTALARKPYLVHLGLETAWARYDPKKDPVPENKLEQLEEILIWLYGSKSRGLAPAIHSQNPDVRILGEVLENEDGLAALRAGRPLSEAHKSTVPPDATLSRELFATRTALRNASINVRGYDGFDVALLNVAKEISATAEMIHDYMSSRLSEAEVPERTVFLDDWMDDGKSSGYKEK